jgi:citrate synthase
MAILTSAFAYLGSYYSEANPSLQGDILYTRHSMATDIRLCVQGQNIFTKGDKASLAIMDKQIYRIIGKATTLAACVPSMFCEAI